MPRETIHDQAGCYDVKVGWRTDVDLQVGIETVGGYSLLTALYGDASTLTKLGERTLPRLDPAAANPTAKLGRDLLNAVEAAGSASFTGVWLTLDRPGINRLIRTLRRARDAAYGRDE